MPGATAELSMDELTVTIDSEAYSMIAIPNEKTRLVQKEIDRILNGVGLRQLVEGLDKTRSLLWLAYNGVAGFGVLRGDINTAQDRLTVICADAILTLKDFETSSNNILSNLTDVFTFLIKMNQPKLALDFMSDCAASARKMEEKATKLANDFDDLAKEVVRILTQTQKEQGLSEEKQRQLQENLAILDAQMKHAEELAQLLHHQVTKLQNEYTEAKEKLERAENRAFAMGIVSAILGPISSGIGAFAGMYAGSGGFSVPPSLPKTKDAPEKPATGTAPKSGEKAEPAASPKSEAKPDATAGPAPQETEHGASSYDQIVLSYQTHRTEVLKLLEEKETLEAQTLASKREFALKMASVRDAQTIQANVTDALFQAVGALKLASTILRNAAFFWRSLGQQCEGLANNNVLKKIDHFQVLSPADQLAFYTKPEFKTQVATHYAQWLAIKVVARDYQAEVTRIRSGIQQDIIANPTTQESIRLTRELGQNLLEKTNQEIAANEKKRKDLSAAA